MKKKRLLAACLALALLPLLYSCSMISDYTLDLKSKLVGIPFTVSTYDYDGQKIDQIKGKSVHIETYKPMSKKNSSGDEQSKVIDVELAVSVLGRLSEADYQARYTTPVTSDLFAGDANTS